MGKIIVVGGISREQGISQAETEGIVDKDTKIVFQPDTFTDTDVIGGAYPPIKGLNDVENLQKVSKIAIMGVFDDSKYCTR